MVTGGEYKINIHGICRGFAQHEKVYTPSIHDLRTATRNPVIDDKPILLLLSKRSHQVADSATHTTYRAP
eukprot:43409-Eustigmatos_ZCMA.PRE.1